MQPYSPKVLVTGGNGQVASALKELCRNDASWVFCARQELDITSKASINIAINKVKPDIIVNTAAYTNVNNAEVEHTEAFAINVDGTKMLAEACQTNVIKLIHLSTDYVFDGMQREPYSENDLTNPINRYGLSKRRAEIVLQDILPQSIILRISSVFGVHGHNFVKTILKTAQHKPLSVVADHYSCPTPASDIARVIMKLVTVRAHGIYHYTTNEAVSWYTFAKEIEKAALEYKCIPFHPIIPTFETSGHPKRPAYSLLNCDKIKHLLSLTQLSWRDALPNVVEAILRDTYDL